MSGSAGRVIVPLRAAADHSTASDMQPTDSPPESQGELVTRADGSRAIRVRKQRLRTPNEPLQGVDLRRRKLRTRLIAAGAALLVIAVIALAALLYPNSAGYRGKLGGLAANATGATVTVSNVAISPGRATADRVELSWPEGNPLASLEVDGISSSVSTLRALGGSFGGEEIRGSRGTLLLRKPVADNPATHAADERGRVSFDRIGVPNLDVFFGDPSVAAGVIFTGTEAAFYPRGPNGLSRVLLHGGALQIPFWPETTLDRALVEFPVGQVDIVSMRVRHARDAGPEGLEPGTCDISGVIRHDLAETSTLGLIFESYQLHSLIGEEAARLVSGRVDTQTGSIESMLRIAPDGQLSMRAELVANTNSQILFSGFPFLGFLSTALEDTWFLNPTFDTISSLTLVREDVGLRIEELELGAPGRMALRGTIDIDVDDGVLGTLEVGIAPGLIESSSVRRLDGMFSETRGGYRWITLELSGNTRMPNDDFNAKFIDTPMPASTPAALPTDDPPPPPVIAPGDGDGPQED